MHSRFYTYWTTANISDCIMLYIFLCSSFKCLAGFPFYILYFCMYDQTFAAQFCEDDDLGGGLCHLWSSDHALLVIHHHHHRDHHHESDEDDVKKESEQLFISSASKVAQDDAAAEEEKSNQDKTQGERSSVALDIFSLQITDLCLDTLQNQMT